MVAKAVKEELKQRQQQLVVQQQDDERRKQQVQAVSDDGQAVGQITSAGNIDFVNANHESVDKNMNMVSCSVHLLVFMPLCVMFSSVLQV